MNDPGTSPGTYVASLRISQIFCKKKEQPKDPMMGNLRSPAKKNEKIPSWTIRNCKIYCGYTV
jgi:hypothetical protein